MNQVLWHPTELRIKQSQLWQFMQQVAPQRTGDYIALWQWSLTHPADFWRQAAQFTGVIGSALGDVIVADVTSILEI